MWSRRTIRLARLASADGTLIAEQIAQLLLPSGQRAELVLVSAPAEYWTTYAG